MPTLKFSGSIEDEKAEAKGETPSTPSRRRRSSRSRTKSPSPTRVLQVEAPTLAPVHEEVQEEPKQETPTKTQPQVQSTPEKKVESPQKVETTPKKVETPPKVEPVVTTPVKAEEKMEVDVKQDKEETEKPENEAQKMEVDASKESSDTQGEQKDDDKKRKRSVSPKQEKKRQKLPPPNIDDFVAEEDEPELDNSKIQLSWFDSDLNLKINRDDFTSATSVPDSSLALVWAGCRANYGVKNNGKYFYEVKLTSQQDKSGHLYGERRMNEFRCGWSVANTIDLQVGEFESSFGLDSSGKKCTNKQFTDYSTCRINLNDIIGVHLVSF